MSRARRIYIASSWKNAAWLPAIALLLRTAGHEVYLFCETGRDHFVFDAHDWKGQDLSTITAKQAWQHEVFRHAFECDKAGLDWADTCILILPAGRSSHLEAGYAVGRGKDLFITGSPKPGEYDTMYGFAKAVCESGPELRDALGD
jgi:hypothetical protein